MKKMKKNSIAVGMAIMLLFTAMIPSEGQNSGPGKIPDDGSIHSLGNGKMCIYEKGPDIVTAYTGPYSTPSFLTLEWMKDALASFNAERKPGTAIWTHTILMGNAKTGEMLDFVDAEIPCFLRHVQTKSLAYSSVAWLAFLDVYLRGEKGYETNRDRIYNLLMQHAGDAGGILFPEGAGVYGSSISQILLDGNERRPESGNFMLTRENGIHEVKIMLGK